MPDSPRSTSRLTPRRKSGLARFFTGGDGRGSTDRPFLGGLTESPKAGWAVVVCLAFVLVNALLAIWAREQPLVSVGRVMDETRIVRLPVISEDAVATTAAKEAERQKTPRVYVAQLATFLELESVLKSLPRTLARVDSLDRVDPGIRLMFGLDAVKLAALQQEAIEGEPTPEWTRRVDAFLARLKRVPLLEGQEWQRAQQEGSHIEILLQWPPSDESRPANTQSGPSFTPGATETLVPRRNIINLADEPQVRSELDMFAREAGFSEPLRAVIVERILRGGNVSTAPSASTADQGKPRPTFRLDAAATARAMDEAAARVETIRSEAPAGQIIFRRGDVLTDAQLALYKQEIAAFAAKGDAWRTWLRAVSLLATVSAITLSLVGYTALFGTRIKRNVNRMVGVCVLLASATAVAVLATAASPQFSALTVTAPTLFVGVILCLAYDQRVALAFCVLHGLLVCVALGLTIGNYATIILGVCAVVWQLREVRDRATIVRMSTFTALALAAATCIIGFLERPLFGPSGAQVVFEIATDSALAAGGCIAVGAATLFILPTIEKLLDITTGMTLTELRDPKHPLLRELQMRAPGTYSHSLNVAAISESAADAIGANSLLTYVGALYHDIGKMNKPEYFVENQSGGYNKHDRLTPAMSLLVIVGHVKDGMELAREYNLPRALQHFIESHHGTTLVEFFFHRAKQQAAAKARAESQFKLAREAELKPSATSPSLATQSTTPSPTPSSTPSSSAATSPAAMTTTQPGASTSITTAPDPTREISRDALDDANMPDEFEYRYPGPKPQTKEAAILMLADAVESASRSLSEPTSSRIEQIVRSIATKRLMDGQFEECEITLRDLNLITESISRTLVGIHHGRIAYPSGQQARA